MRSCSIALALCVCLFCASQSSSQTASSPPTDSSSPKAIIALQSAYSALAPTAAVNDITLTGTAEWIAGSDDETGTVTYLALPGANHLGLSLSGGPRNETRSATGPTGSWSGSDAIPHPIAYHNLLTDPGWFPLFTLSAIASSPTSIVTYVGAETHDGLPTVHLSASQVAPSSSVLDPTLFQHLTHVDIYLDPKTFLPVSYVYTTHPDNNQLIDIVREIRYSNYRSSSGQQIPFHVQSFLNNCLDLDLQFQKVSANSGLTAAQIVAQ